MSNIITVKVEPTQEVLDRLDKIIELLGKGHNCSSCVQTAVAMTKDLAETAKTAQEPPKVEPVTEDTPAGETAPAPEPAPAAEPEKVEPKYSKADIQQKVVSLSAAGKKAKVREVVMAYGTKVSDIPEDKYDEVMAKLNELEV